LINQKLMSAAAAGACAKASMKLGQQVGWFNIEYSHKGVTPKNHANIAPLVKLNVHTSSSASGGEWCTDDVRKDKMVI
jgi:hypothetical protein